MSLEASAQDDLARELPRIQPLEPAAALRLFRVHPGFDLEQVAAEPMVINPVSACYDADGRLYVVEMCCGYPYPEQTPTGRVARLEDRDGDGRFDSRTFYLAAHADPNIEFLASIDNWFRPVNFAKTSDGTLLILDMYRDRASLVHSRADQATPRSGQWEGSRPALQPSPRGAATHQPRRRPRLGQAPTAELVSLLADPDAWWRETAQRLLMERRDASAAPLLEDLVARRPTALGRLHALWTLDVLAALPAPLLTSGIFC